MSDKTVILFNRDNVNDSARPTNPFPGFSIVELDKFDDLENRILRDKLGLPHDPAGYIQAMRKFSEANDVEVILAAKWPDGRVCNAYLKCFLITTETRAKEIKAAKGKKAVVVK